MHRRSAALAPEHAATINTVLTASKAEGRPRAAERWSEKPLADRAERVLRRAKELGAIEEGG